MFCLLLCLFHIVHDPHLRQIEVTSRLNLANNNLQVRAVSFNGGAFRGKAKVDFERWGQWFLRRHFSWQDSLNTKNGKAKWPFHILEVLTLINLGKFKLSPERTDQKRVFFEKPLWNNHYKNLQKASMECVDLRHSSVRGLMIAEFCYSFLWPLGLTWKGRRIWEVFPFSPKRNGTLRGCCFLCDIKQFVCFNKHT